MAGYIEEAEQMPQSTLAATLPPKVCRVDHCDLAALYLTSEWQVHRVNLEKMYYCCCLSALQTMCSSSPTFCGVVESRIAAVYWMVV